MILGYSEDKVVRIPSKGKAYKTSKTKGKAETKAAPKLSIVQSILQHKPVFKRIKVKKQFKTETQVTAVSKPKTILRKQGSKVC